MEKTRTSYNEYLLRYARPRSPNGRSMQLYAHKGNSGLMPENSIPAYEACLPLGVDVVDADLALTAEKTIVISHNQTLNPHITRTSGPDGKLVFIPACPVKVIKNLSLEELCAYDVGTIDSTSEMAISFPAQRQMDGVQIPRLSSLIDLLRMPGNERVRLNVEIKVDLSHPDYVYPTNEIVPLLIQELDDHGMLARTEIQSFDWNALHDVGCRRPEATRAFLSDPGNPQWVDWFQCTYPNAPHLTICNYAEVMVDTIKKLETPGISIWEPYGGQFRHARKAPLVANPPKDAPLVDALTREMVVHAHARGFPVVSWTLYDSVSEPPAYKPYSAALSRSTAVWMQMGVDGILTNRADIARGIMAAHGFRLPLVPS